MRDPTFSPPGATNVEHVRVPLNVAAFAAPLWDPPPPPPSPPRQATPRERTRLRPPPFRLQLIAIIDEKGERQAVLYDPDGDELRYVHSGDTVNNALIESIAETRIAIRLGSSRRSLVLVEEEGGADR